MNLKKVLYQYLWRKRRFQLLIGLIALLITFIFSTFSSVVIDIENDLTPTTRSLCLAGVCLVTLLAFIIFGIRNAMRYKWENAMRDIEENDPESGQLLRTAAEWEGKDCSEEEASFVNVTLAQAKKRLDETRHILKINWARVVLPLLAILISFGVITSFVFSSLTFKTAFARLFDPYGGHTWNVLQLNIQPKLLEKPGSVHARLNIDGRKVEQASLFRRLHGDNWIKIDEKKNIEENKCSWEIKNCQLSFELKATAGDGTSNIVHFVFDKLPEVKKVKKKVIYPHYLGLEPELLSGNNISIVEGATIVWDFEIDTPMSSANLNVDGQIQKVDIDQNFSSNVQGSYTVTAGEHEVILTGKSFSGKNLESWKERITGHPDKLPEIKITYPVKTPLLTKVWELPVNYKARDDYGLAEMGLVIKVADQEYELEKFDYKEKKHYRAHSSIIAQLERYPLKINEHIRIYAYAKDHRAGKKRSVSEILDIDIRQFLTLYGEIEAVMGADLGAFGLALMKARIKLDEVIKKQRVVVSDIFKEKEMESKDQTIADRIAEREKVLAKVVNDIFELLNEVSEQLLSKDVQLIKDAAALMKAAVESLNALQWPDAFTEAETALSKLIELRKKIEIYIIKNTDLDLPPSEMAGEGQDDKKKDQKTLEELAKEAERLAKEERSLKQKLSNSHPFALLRRQKKAVDDGNNLFDDINKIDEATKYLLETVEEAEIAMGKSERHLKKNKREEASTSLGLAGDRLQELAEHLRGLDLKRKIKILKEMAEKTKIAEQLLNQEQGEHADEELALNENGEGEGESKEENEGKGKGSGKREQKEPHEHKNQKQEEGKNQGEGKGQQEHEGNGQGEGQGKEEAQQDKAQQQEKGQGEGPHPGGPGQGQKTESQKGGPGSQSGESKEQDSGKGSGSGRGRGKGKSKSPSPVPKLMSQMKMMQDWLDNMINNENDSEARERLQKLNEDLDYEGMVDDLKRLDELRQKGKHDDAGEHSRELARRFRGMSKALQEEYKRRTQSDIEKLAKLKHESEDLIAMAEKKKNKEKSSAGSDKGDKGDKKEKESGDQSGGGSGEKKEEKKGDENNASDPSQNMSQEKGAPGQGGALSDKNKKEENKKDDDEIEKKQNDSQPPLMSRGDPPDKDKNGNEAKKGQGPGQGEKGGGGSSLFQEEKKEELAKDDEEELKKDSTGLTLWKELTYRKYNVSEERERIYDLADELNNIGDDELQRMASELTGDLKMDERRLQKIADYLKILIAERVKNRLKQGLAVTIPHQYKNAVEEYRRDLSDDFEDE